jgi:hypothetical protein
MSAFVCQRRWAKSTGMGPASMDQKADGPTKDLVLCRNEMRRYCLLRCLRRSGTLVPPWRHCSSCRPSSVIQSFENASTTRPSLTEIFLSSIDGRSGHERARASSFVVIVSMENPWRKRPHAMWSQSFNRFNLVSDRFDTRERSYFCCELTPWMIPLSRYLFPEDPTRIIYCAHQCWHYG